MTQSATASTSGTLASALADALVERSGRPEGVDEQESTLAHSLLLDATQQRATDVHVDPYGDGHRVRFRIDGELLDAAILSDDDGDRLVNQIKAFARLDPVASFSPERARTSYPLEGRKLDLRITATPCLGGSKLAIRILDPAAVIQNIDQIGLAGADRQTMKRWLDEVEGMLVVTGPTGSGKTTTLYGLLHELTLLDRCVLTIEDPAEYAIRGITQIQVDEQHGLTFEAGLKTMLRLDPDYLMVGEIRSRESARVAANAASTGLKVMSTLHSSDAVGTVTALQNWGLSGHEIADALRIVVAQRLVPLRLCEHCRERVNPEPGECEWLIGQGGAVPDSVWRANGCEACSGRGYIGRTGVFELWRPNAEELETIRRGGDTAELYAQLKSREHAFILHDGLAKVVEGTTTLAELRRNRLGVATTAQF